MQPTIPFALAATLLALPAFAPAIAEEPQAETTEQPSAGEIELAELLEGREAGEPVKCLRRHQRNGLQIVDRTALVFRDGDTLYVNRTRDARFLDEWDLPVFRQFGTSLCEFDQVELRDRSGAFPGPVLFLEEFVPYTKSTKEG